MASDTPLGTVVNTVGQVLDNLLGTGGDNWSAAAWAAHLDHHGHHYGHHRAESAAESSRAGAALPSAPSGVARAELLAANAQAVSSPLPPISLQADAQYANLTTWQAAAPPHARDDSSLPADWQVVRPELNAERAAMFGAAVAPASEQALAAAQIARRAAAIAAAFRVGGEIDGARELRARTRDLPPSVAAEVMVASRTTVESMVSLVARGQPPGERVERVERWDGAAMAVRHEPPEPTSSPATRRVQAAADIAGAIAHAARDARGEMFARDMAGVVLDGATARSEEYRLSSFALGVPFGTGLALPLALADRLGQRGDRHRQGQLLAAIGQGLRGLKDRVSATVSALVRLTLPLVARAAGDQEADPGENRLAGLLREQVARDPSLLRSFAEGLRRVDAAGTDVFLALDSLSRRSEIPLELRPGRDDLVTSPTVAFAIAQSVTVRGIVVERCRAGQAEPAGRAPVEGAQRVFTTLGFSQSRSLLLARATCAWQSAVVMDARWIEVTGTADLDEAGGVFEALLRFVGAAATPRQIAAVELSHLDDAEGTSEIVPEPAWGLPLLRSLEQAA